MRVPLDAFLTSTAVVALAEMGDKTQLLALILAARYRAPTSVGLGILVATLLNHLGTAAAGMLAASLLDGPWMRWIVAGAFIGIGLWTLIPDKLDDEETAASTLSAFPATVIAFFLAELGDKTQFATAVLAAEHQALFAVTAGTTLGMMAANLPVVALGPVFTRRLPLDWLRRGAAALFIATGLYAFFSGPGL